MIGAVAWSESCDCCGRTARHVGTRYGWQTTGTGPTREVIGPCCRRPEHDRAQDVMVP